MFWNWKMGGMMLGLCFFLAVALVKPIGVSTQFVIADGIAARLFYPELVEENEDAQFGFSSPNAYLDKSGGKYAKSIANPLNYGFVFVLSMFAGGLMGRLLTKNSSGDPVIRQIPSVHLHRFGSRPMMRYALAFLGGVLVLWGARLAGGCTGGHMMSGMMQTSVSGYLFAAAAFVTAIPAAILIYRQ